jgi:hypothetical protein
MESALKKAEAAITQAAEKVKHSSAAISSPHRAGRRTPAHKRSPKRRAGTTRRSKPSKRT